MGNQSRAVYLENTPYRKGEEVFDAETQTPGKSHRISNNTSRTKNLQCNVPSETWLSWWILVEHLNRSSPRFQPFHRLE